VGVELGQLAFVAGALIFIAIIKKLFQGSLNSRVVTLLSAYLIGGVSSYWVVERIAAF
jgi:hypothetical protein